MLNFGGNDVAKKVILRTQANRVFEIMKRIGLEPSEFTWEERQTQVTSDKDIVSALIHKPNNSSSDLIFN